MDYMINIMITGIHPHWVSASPDNLAGVPIHWIEVPVIDFIEMDWELDDLGNPPQWIIFASPRAVEFWSRKSEVLERMAGVGVACMGEVTRECALKHGWKVTFCPVGGTGSEVFVSEFAKKVQGGSQVWIPGAEEGRRWIDAGLSDLGVSVTRIPVYRTVPCGDLGDRQKDLDGVLEKANGLVFTSPSSVKALLGVCQLPEHLKLAVIGSFTAEELQRRGHSAWLFPKGDVGKLQEWTDLSSSIRRSE